MSSCRFDIKSLYTYNGTVAPSPAQAPDSSSSNLQAAQFTKSESTGGLHRSDLNPSDPIAQFHEWFNGASSSSSVPHPETCTLSTASLPSGRVSARMVYLKELDSKGFVLYSNFGTSRKAADLATNSWASLVFWWEALERQVRVEGRAARLSPEESKVYYDTRARGSRIGAWSSKQSQVLEPRGENDDGRAQLEGWVAETEKRFEGSEDIPIPEFWGGLRIVPETIEFWQGRNSRLHDRFVYTRQEGEEGWKMERLSP